jgi:DNA-binding NtrC family response regulator
MNVATRILVVDDEKNILVLFKRMLTDEAFRDLNDLPVPLQRELEVDTAPSGETAWEKIQLQTYDLIISDLAMEGMNGIELLEKTKSVKPDIPFMILTGVGTIEDAVRSMKLGAYDYLTKPFQHDELLLSISKALDYGRLHSEVKTLREKLDSNETKTKEDTGKTTKPELRRTKAQSDRYGAADRFPISDDQASWIRGLINKNYSMKLISERVSGEVEKNIIEMIIKEIGENKAELARRLGISRPALYKKLKDHGIE